jgi:hypothetical protein
MVISLIHLLLIRLTAASISQATHLIAGLADRALTEWVYAPVTISAYLVTAPSQGYVGRKSKA